MPLFAVDYAYPAESATARDELRPQHRAWLGELYEAGTVRTSGPYPDGSGALIVIEADSLATLEDLLMQDPFRKADVLGEIRIKEWLCVFEWRS